jgi:uncharacterized protein (TIGR02594 family)
VVVKETKSENDNWYFLTHDHLGSVHCILNEESELLQELSFDPYGNRRDPNTWQAFVENTEPVYLLDRGYTMHEHWDEFTLINMNGRMYDPMIGRFLSPDPYVQSPDYSQNFNRYSYALNNSLKFTDPSGEWIHILMGAIIGGVINWATNGFQFNAAGLGYFAVGAVAGALGAGIGAGVGGLVSGAGHFSFGVASSLSVGGMGALGGAAIGAGAGLVSGFVTGFGNALVGQENIGNALKLGVTSAAWGAAIGGVTGAIGGAIRAHREGVNIWKGYPKHMAVADPGRAAFPTGNRGQSTINTTRSNLAFDYKSSSIEVGPISEGKILSEPWMDYAIDQIGQAEASGSTHNPKILEYLKTTGNFTADETPWCSAFANWSMKQAGISGTNSARALSWNNWGQTLNDPTYGSVAVIDYGNGRGHVGFVAGQNEAGDIILLGGNQSDMVKYSTFKASSISRYVYPNGYGPNSNLPTINMNELSNFNLTR